MFNSLIKAEILVCIFLSFACVDAFGNSAINFKIKKKAAAQNTKGSPESNFEVDGLPARIVGAKIFIKLQPGEEIELPNPQVFVDESKFPNASKDSAQMKAKFVAYANKYIDAFESEYLKLRGIDKQNSPFSAAKENIGASLSDGKKFNFIRLKDILKNKMLKTAIVSERLKVPALYKEIAEASKKIKNLNIEVQNLKSENQSLKEQLKKK